MLRRIDKEKEAARSLARQVTRTKGYRVDVDDVRRAWSAVCTWPVETIDARTGERLLLLSKDNLDDHLTCTTRVVAQQHG